MVSVKWFSLRLLMEKQLGPIKKVSCLESCEEKLTLSYEQPTTVKSPIPYVRPKRTAGLDALKKIKSIATQEIEDD